MELNRTEPLKVICINPKTSTKLIKNGIYTATALRSYNGTNKTLYIKNVGSYSASNFTTLDGKNVNYIKEFNSNKNNINEHTNYKGQYIRCSYSGGSRYLKEGEIYYVEYEKMEPRYTYLNQVFYDKKFKLRGIKNIMQKYRFEEIPIKEQRNIKLKKLNGKKPNIITGDQTRKFLLYNDREKLSILIELLTKSLIDINNIELLGDDKLDIIELILKKGKKYRIIREDILDFYKHIKPILKPYSDILDLKNPIN